MKILKAAMYLLVMSCVSAIAADFPSIKSEPIAVPAPVWTGFYAGLNAGGILGASNSVTTSAYPIYQNPDFRQTAYVAARAGSTNIDVAYGGFIGGGQIGYMWNPIDRIISGIELDFSGIAGSGNNSKVNVAQFINYVPDSYWISNTNVNKNLQYLGTVRGKLGYLITPDLLAYGSGGFAYGGVSFSTTVTQIGVPDVMTGPSTYNFDPPNWFSGYSNKNNARVGWNLGGGIEWMFARALSAKVEYIYYDLGSATNQFNSIRPDAVKPIPIALITQSYSTTRFNGNIVRAGVNYHFNFANVAPIVAKF